MNPRDWLSSEDWLNCKDWLNSVAQDLYRSGLPDDYVKRTCGELADHAEECVQAGKEFEILKQSPDDFCVPLVRNYRHRTIFGRLPPLCCLIAPLVLVLITPLAYYTLAGLLLEGSFVGTSLTRDTTPLKSMIIWATFYVGVVSVPLVSTAVVNVWVRQMARQWKWSAIMFALLFLGTASVSTTLRVVGDDTELSLVVNLPLGGVNNFCHWAQCLVVVVLGYVIVRRQCNQQRMACVVIDD